MRTTDPKKNSELAAPHHNAPLVAFLGPVGTFSHAAVLERFGQAVGLLELPTIDDVFSAVEARDADFGVVPVENSTEGAVNNTLDCLVDTRLKIVGEVVVPIVHHFMYRPGTDPARLRKVVSHKQSLAQCRKWLAKNQPGLLQVECASNGEAARMAATGGDVAAIAGEMASKLYGLEIAHRAIQDQADNSTRFLVLGREAVGPTGRDKTSTLIYTENRPGALFRVLEPFERHQVSLTRIETRPSRKAVWDYVFFVDFEGHVDDEPVRQVLAKLRGGIAEVKLLGSYPMAVR
ncbi:MAG: P-protein [Pseudomonadota bacterium]